VLSLEWTPQARDDLADIQSYTEQYSPRAAADLREIIERGGTVVARSIEFSYWPPSRHPRIPRPSKLCACVSSDVNGCQNPSRHPFKTALSIVLGCFVGGKPRSTTAHGWLGAGGLVGFFFVTIVRIVCSQFGGRDDFVILGMETMSI